MSNENEIISTILSVLKSSDYWIGILTVFTLWISKTLWEKYQEYRKPNSHDYELWNNINSIMNESSVEFWRGQDMGGSFELNRTDSISRLVDFFFHEKPETCFLDKSLERKKKRLVGSLRDFSLLIGQNFVTSHLNQGWLVLTDDKWPNRDPIYDEKAKELNIKATEFVHAYNSFKSEIIKKLLNKKVNSEPHKPEM